MCLSEQQQAKNIRENYFEKPFNLRKIQICLCFFSLNQIILKFKAKWIHAYFYDISPGT